MRDVHAGRAPCAALPRTDADSVARDLKAGLIIFEDTSNVNLVVAREVLVPEGFAHGWNPAFQLG